MRKIIIIGLSSVSIVLVLAIGGARCLPYYKPAVEQSGLHLMDRVVDDTIRVSFIGDSWAERQIHFQDLLEKQFQSMTNSPVKVMTAGVSGLTSKNVYYSIFRNNQVRTVIEWKPDYCIIAAGINDSDRKMGKGYYKENMRLIISLLLDYHIVPVLLEIPDYDIYNSFNMRNRQVKMSYIFSMLVTFSKMDCKEDYRRALDKLIKENKWADNVLVIRREVWNPEGTNDSRGLYDEGLMHLTEKGYAVLDSCIAYKIIHHLKTR